MLQTDRVVLKLLQQRKGLIAGMVLAIALTAGAFIFSTDQGDPHGALTVSADLVHETN